MAKLVIKKREDAKGTNGISLRDYDVTIDGNEISHMTGLSLTMGVDEFNHCSMTFFIDHMDVDAEFLAAIKAQVEDDRLKAGLEPTGHSEEPKVFLDGKELE